MKMAVLCPTNVKKKESEQKKEQKKDGGIFDGCTRSKESEQIESGSYEDEQVVAKIKSKMKIRTRKSLANETAKLKYKSCRTTEWKEDG